MMFPGESSITAGEFFQNHEKYTSRACPFLSWALVGRVTTHQKNISNPLRIPCLSNRCFKRLGCFKPSQRMIAGRHAADSRTEVLEKDEQRAQLEVDGSWWGFRFQCQLWSLLDLCIILHLQPWHLWRKWPDGHLPQRDPDCESKLTDLSRSPKGWHFWGPFPAGVGQASLGIAMAAMDDGKSTDDQSIMDLFASNCVGSLFLQIV